MICIGEHMLVFIGQNRRELNRKSLVLKKIQCSEKADHVTLNFYFMFKISFSSSKLKRLSSQEERTSVSSERFQALI